MIVDPNNKPMRIMDKKILSKGQVQYLVDYQDKSVKWFLAKDFHAKYRYLIEMYEYSLQMEEQIYNEKQAKPLSKGKKKKKRVVSSRISSSRSRSNSKKRKSRHLFSESESEKNIYLVQDEKDTHLMGSFYKGDRVESILNGNLHPKQKKWRFLVSWKERANGFVPKGTWCWQDALYQFEQECLLEYLKRIGKLQVFRGIMEEQPADKRNYQLLDEDIKIDLT